LVRWALLTLLFSHSQRIKLQNQTHVGGIIERILSEISDAADDLETELNDHAFEDAAKQNEVRNRVSVARSDRTR